MSNDPDVTDHSDLTDDSVRGGDSPSPGYPRIGDHAIIGDCRTAALVSGRGSIDWLCLPRFDSPSFFARILDRTQGGCFSFRPEGPFETERRYLPSTNVLETTFRTDDGVVKLTDLMPVTSEELKREVLWPQHQILRIVDCVKGRVSMEMRCEPRPDYARRSPRLEDRGSLGYIYQAGSNALFFRADFPLESEAGGVGLVGRTTLEEGDRRHASLTYTRWQPAVIPAFGAVAEQKLQATVSWWRSWISQMEYDGPFREAVARSALTLKLLTYAPSGALIAAPTTSLPERIGGVRNWDYRYCWLRDASMTLRALFELGFTREGDAFLSWLLHATALSWPELRPIYDVHGEIRIPERELDHLEGYRGSRPVRVGNAARKQLQLDVYGDLMDGAYEYVARGGTLDPSSHKHLVRLGEEVCRCWDEPDSGIWEIRADPKHHTYSKVMCWVALDRLIRFHHDGHFTVPLEKFQKVRDRIRARVEEEGYDTETESYVTAFGERSVDASLLLLQRYGYQDPASNRMQNTVKRIEEELAEGPLLYRYVDKADGLPPGEGAFGISSFWAVECLCRQGKADEPRERFEKLLGYANDVGLFAEEVDPETGEHLGNFPQAFTHVGLIDAALTLSECMGRRRPRERSAAGLATEPETA
ncbi:MAG: glycoside hydrolase family 15 protein [Gemmatimonadota bacterium]